MRKHFLWTEANWNDGYHDNRGRFRVYRPDYPRAFNQGYALRYWVVWWLKTGKAHPNGYDLHHKNEIKDDDRYENLALLPHGVHARDHVTVEKVKLKCRFCLKFFYRLPCKKFRKYCSNICYQKAPRTKKHNMNISNSLKKAYRIGAR